MNKGGRGAKISDDYGNQEVTLRINVNALLILIESVLGLISCLRTPEEEAIKRIYFELLAELEAGLIGGIGRPAIAHLKERWLLIFGIDRP